ncbi:type III-A CRISPR-associated RAMP protein Csm5 [Thermosulfurimonas marina]|uniref:CRISPR system Cms protein Csm5 n=1 Tax=Thermosulfurimonas marina TaxID=2047767 RepID=A0A6H1WUH7_9BACT|nr:type III-A CRISPR-associated RAMP protein Csm5 [Thermosulfurimonas marina]QJA06831.1 type III-A CRISPR-associated RAMP protein Csm5 [Thermosulfurimonas marina]
MKALPLEVHKVRLKVLSPLHLGTGEVYEPTEFFVHPDGYLGVLDFERFVAHFDEKELRAFKLLCQKGTTESLAKLYLLVDGLARKFIRERGSDFVRRHIPVSQDFLDHYKSLETLLGNPRKLANEFKKFTIYRTAFSPNEGVPIIPGSAVKGALRTAILNFRRKKVEGKTWQDYCYGKSYDSKQLEADILDYTKDRFQNDPFRLLKVSDFRPLGSVKTRIVYAVNRKKAGGEARGPFQILEVIEPGAVFEGEITLIRSDRRGIILEEIVKALASFYGKEAGREFEILSRLGAGPPEFPSGAYPLRLGRHSGAECVTIEGFRHIYIRGARGRDTYRDQATTVWLASEQRRPESTSGLKPFGWAALYIPETEVQADPRPPDLQKLGRRFKLVVKKKK